PADADAVLAALRGAAIEVDDGVLVVAGSDVKDALRSPEVTTAVSTVAAHAAVRTEVVEMQRRWVAAQGGRAVVEGRDIGTV
ncbi:MAG: cytidylate kinase, partial [Actinobacteria bacterium]|nr:cytidylate kinase [Actinomycetota bacterium]NIS34259.1 cytidylate kinase [Actinomycetota bacterium]NIU69038.1 cytidylate kinase [Actinomycetota bacterium]NIW30897.1 cytidylate kinase [Actinomycetota bacterium]